ncbi:hypothetical protein [Rossellomorea aquimaris]|uniref:Uncharacterized protein n=1 Tax=Rossellomorea aquimaris TaxID=189382 RepID=A0A366EN95_9BACI|nr:hypothetical protein [Rossellomorea aquimaris]RBP03170.1 hypothetical protein DET59_11052 [Rossellomorea aquimaris]
MEGFHLIIGEHLLQITGKKSEFFSEFKRDYKPFIYRGYKQSDLLINIEKGYGSSFINHHVTINQKADKIYYQRADYLIETSHDFKSANIYVQDKLALKHALMNLYSAFILHHNWGILIHSSCVIENGKAHIFSGNSGAGKSTAAKLSLPRDLLSDEATILKVTEGAMEVFNSPFRSELESADNQKPCPLRSIQLLTQSLTNKRVHLKKSVALVELTDKVFFWCHKPEESSRIFHLLTALVKEVPAYELHFQKNNTFWELIS